MMPHHKFLPLSHMRPGSTCVIRKVFDNNASARMFDMGLLPDTRLELIRQAPLAGPLAFKVRGFCLSLRQSEADNILVEEVAV